jgi:ankyrin repeat protein
MQPIDWILQPRSQAELRRFLDQQNASPDQLAEWLGMAIAHGRASAIEALLLEGADPNRVPPSGRWAAVHAAVAHEAPDVLRLLAVYGGDPNRPDRAGMTPLHLAIDVEIGSAHQSGTPASASLTAVLLELGADPELEDATGRTPEQWADQYGHAAALALLSTGRRPAPT